MIEKPDVFNFQSEIEKKIVQKFSIIYNTIFERFSQSLDIF